MGRCLWIAGLGYNLLALTTMISANGLVCRRGRNAVSVDVSTVWDRV